ncbi:MAG TPA: NAD-dependent epimerase/dehydratase family protein [Candidatus Nitrosocosmicus sp.]|nr:NAD-dependent epimerase/dehydratase family protein [Candidatus Nitrosocosmicus sp.]
MTTLVTGAFGCIGSWVIKRLLAAGERAVVYDLGDDPWRMRMLVGEAPLRDVTMVRGDIADKDALIRVIGAHGIDRVIHLAAWQVPLCRQDPARGALVNVVGTANVFEAVKAHRDRVSRVVYFSSAAVFGPPEHYGPGPVTDDSPPRPATHYGVYKVANEETARIYWEEHKIPSMGFRPLSVYGPGRDFGLTADPTLAMKAAVLGRPYQIRWGGATDLIYAEDVAQACIAASTSTLDRARVYNLHGESAKIAEVVRMIEDEWPAAKGKLSHVEQPIPFPGALDDPGYQRDLGPRPRTGLRDGIRKTLDEFAALQKAGRLDARELDPPRA